MFYRITYDSCALFSYVYSRRSRFVCQMIMGPTIVIHSPHGDVVLITGDTLFKD